MRIAPLVILLFALISAAHSAPPVSCTDTKAIDAYAVRLESAMKGMKARTFVGAIGEPDWQEVKPDETEGTSATARFDSTGALVMASFTIAGESGDWVHYANYFFRPDGSLGKLAETLNTFHGRATVMRTTYFGCHGEAYPGTTRHLDLKTKAPKTPDPEFVDEHPPSIPHIRELPFFSSL